jgi:CheY-like chemotaxis protein
MRLARQSLSRIEMEEKKTVLVVDDDVVSLQAIGGFLEQNGYGVVTCSDGPMAVQKARTNQPNLILLDLALPSPRPAICPIFDGYTVMGWLRSFQDTSTTPIFVLTASTPEAEREKAFLAGAVAFFRKPADPNRLLNAIRIALDQF